MRKIIFVSRLDADCSLGASILCDISLKLHKKYPDLQILIIGGGEKYPEFRTRANKINEIINCKLIRVTGNVDSPSEYFEKNSLFVGVSRASLEAMAHGLPVVLLGNEGFLGLLDQTNLKKAEKTNFTCRKYRLCSNTQELRALLFDEICRYFELPEEKKQELSDFSYQIAKNKYSSQKTAEKTVEFYREVLNNYHKNSAFYPHSSPKIAICGYYGHKNLGDEAILSAICEMVHNFAPNSRVCIMGNKNPIKNLSDLRSADAFIFGGGSLLQNSTSNASLFYYLTTIAAANLLCKQKIMLANGIGPFKNNIIPHAMLLKLIAHTVNNFDFISVRDTESQKMLSSLLPGRSIHLMPDPALIHAQNINRKLFIQKQKKYFAYIPCTRGLKKAKISPAALANTLRYIEKEFNVLPMIIVLNQKEDLILAKQVKKHIPQAKIICTDAPRELFSLFEKVDFVISQRYHGSLFAASCKLPVLCVSNDPKMQGLCKDFKLFPRQSTNILSLPEEITSNLYKISNKNQELGLNEQALKSRADLSNKYLQKIIKNI